LRKTLGIDEVLSSRESLEEKTSSSDVKNLEWTYQVAIVLFDLD
jgi:hypothetical protein